MPSRIWLSSPHFSGREQDYIDQAFRDNWVASNGENVNRFEGNLQRFLGETSRVAVLSSGTAALHLALVMLGVGVGDEVLCQSLTFSATANPIVYQGAAPIFVDSEPETWNICPEALETAIKDRIARGTKPKAIIVVHLYGMPAKMSELLSIAHRYEIPLVEDAAEALGSAYQGQKCGTFGDLSVLSFNGNKIITTSGGGALVSQSQEDKDRAIFLATQARDHAPHYQHSQIGYNYRMTNIAAGIGCGQMEVLTERIAQRRDNHSFYRSLVEPLAGISILTEPSEAYFSNHWLSVILIDKELTGFDREELRLRFLADNIETRPAWKPMHLQPIFSQMPYYGGCVSERLFNLGLCLPSGSNLTDEDRQRVAEVLTNTF